MDILDAVREMKPDHAFTPHAAHAPRRALHREMARSERVRPLKRVALITVGGAAAAAIAVAASTFAPPGTVGEPQAASAATYLNETAASIRAAAVTGQPARITVTIQHLGMVGGPNEKFQPFGDIKNGATGAVVTESSSTYAGEPDGTYSEVARTEFHAQAVYGDKASVEAAWNSYYGETDIGVLGTEPSVSTETWPTGREEPLPVPVAGFPDDPEAFLEAWIAGMDALMVAEKTEAAKRVTGDPEESGVYDGIHEHFRVPAAEHMLHTLFLSVPLHIGPAEYRATFLEALALAEGIAVEEDSASNKVLVYEGAESRYRLTIDPAAGAIVKFEQFLLKVPGELWTRHTKDDPPVDVGSAAFLPADIPSRVRFFTSEPVS